MHRHGWIQVFKSGEGVGAVTGGARVAASRILASSPHPGAGRLHCGSLFALFCFKSLKQVRNSPPHSLPLHAQLHIPFPPLLFSPCLLLHPLSPPEAGAGGEGGPPEALLSCCNQAAHRGRLDRGHGGSKGPLPYARFLGYQGTLGGGEEERGRDPPAAATIPNWNEQEHRSSSPQVSKAAIDGGGEMLLSMKGKGKCYFHLLQGHNA